MKHQSSTFRRVAATVLATAGIAPFAGAQSADALLDKLVEKGVISVKEANELRNETDAGFNKAYHAKTGLPDWVTSMRVYGDFRGRYEGFFFENDNAPDRNRYRYRLRLGLTATLADDFEVGTRLTSSEPVGNFGGDPISSNSTLTDNASKKFVYLDLAYAKWTPLHRAGWVGSMTLGKMENPFQVSDIVFDGDYTPEGFAGQVSYAPNDKHTLGLIGGLFVLDESFAVDTSTASNPGAGGHDAWSTLTGIQGLWNASWNQKISSGAYVAWYPINNEQLLTTNGVPNVNTGNPHNTNPKDQPGFPPSVNFSPVVLGGNLTYTIEKVPFYKSAFPVKVGGEYINNPMAEDANSGWWAGVTFGKAGKKGLWEFTYRYKHLESAAWWEELVDSDFGAYYSAVPQGSGLSRPGYAAGTNVKGHIFRAAYNFYDSTSLQVTYALTDLIDPPAGTKDAGTGRLQVDLNWKF